MTTPLVRPGRLRAVLRQVGRAIPRAIPWRRGAASGVPPTRLAHNGPVGIAYDVRGHGRPLVLVQGVGIGRWGWEPVVDRLARRFRVISVDNRGVGASDTPPGHFSTRSMAQDVLAVLDHAGIQQASVLGTSLGGMIAQELALAHPERVDRLVLIGQYYNSSGKVTGGLDDQLRAGGDQVMGFLRAEYDQVSPDGPDHFPVVYAKMLQMLATEPELDLGSLAAVGAPTLVLQGDRDEVTLEHGAAVAAALPQARLAVLPGTHLLPMENPEVVNALLLWFLGWPQPG